MSEQREQVPLDPNLTLILLIEDLENVILGINERKPARPEVWEAFGRIDKLRRELQRSVGQEPTEISDPHGRVSYDKPQKEVK